MTEVPPPPPHDPGAYPLPPNPGGFPPPSGAYPPLPQPGNAPLPGGTFEMWIKRVGAYIVDFLPATILVWIGQYIAMSTADNSTCAVSTYDTGSGTAVDTSCVPDITTAGYAGYILFSVAALAWVIWNSGYRQGTTGSSIGKGLLGIKVVGEYTGLPIGFGMSVVRQLAHILDSLICGIGYLLPLFTQKRQTIADMLVKTVVVPR